MLTGTSALATGNVRYLDLRADGAVQYRTSFAAEAGQPQWLRDRFVLNLHGAFKSVDQVPVFDERLAHLRLTRMFVPHWGAEAFGQYQNDFTLLLERRLVAGAGLRFAIFEEPRLGLWGGTGYMAEDERRLVDPAGPDPVHMLNHRSTTYIASRLGLVPEKVMWINTIYLQPRLDDPADLQLLDESTLQAAVSKWLTLTMALRLRLDTRAPSTLAPLDIKWTTGFTVRWAAEPDSDAAG